MCAANMNKFTIEKTAADLAAQGLGPAGFGIEITAKTAFPLRGMLWEVQSRPFFSTLGTIAPAEQALYTM